MQITDREGRSVPLFFDDYEYHSIATIDFSPIEDPSPPITASALGLLQQRGFLVRPNADGTVYGITLYRYIKNGNSLTGLSPKRYMGVANQWIECRFIKIYAHNDAHFVTTATAMNIAFTI